MRNRSWARVAAAIWTACIVVAVVGRGSHKGRHLATDGALHNTTHVAVFALLGSLLTLSFASARFRYIALFGAALFGLSTEIYEHIVFRSPMEYIDVFTDVCGVVLGSYLTLWVQSKRAAR